MAPRAIWKGAVSFGMVAIPIRLYPATQSKDLAFVTLHSSCHTRLKHRRFCPHHEEFVELTDVVKGYEYSKDQYVVMEESDFGDLPVPSKHTIEITRFIDLSSIDPVYYDRSYILEPESVGEKPFFLLKRALESTERVAIAKVSLRQKEHLCCLRPFESGLVMATMHDADEIRGIDELNLQEEQVNVTEQELAMATTLIDQLTGSFEPGEHQDEYRTALERVIEGKLGAPQPDVVSPAPVKGKVGDLMEALRASIEATKQAAGAQEAEQPAAGARTSRSKKKTPVRSGS